MNELGFFMCGFAVGVALTVIVVGSYAYRLIIGGR